MVRNIPKVLAITVMLLFSVSISTTQLGNLKSHPELNLKTGGACSHGR